MSILKTNYKDDVIDSEQATDRKFSEIDNGDNTYSYSDVTPYTQEGDEYGAEQINFENTHCNFAIESADRTYEGVDLTVEFADEIAEYTDVWRWIKARIAAHKLDGIHVGDYIPFYIGSYAIKAEIAGINPYLKCTDQELAYHIDWISRDLYPVATKWKDGNNNNGTSAQQCPYLGSDVKSFLDGLVSSLPAGLQAVIAEKRFLLEKRYSSGGTVTDSTGWGWESLGKLWIPSEYEVFGSVVWGTKGYSSGMALQYPIFANNWRKRIKGNGDGGSRANWWLLSVFGGNSTDACIVNTGGGAVGYGTSSEYRVPVCFRISE